MPIYHTNGKQALIQFETASIRKYHSFSFCNGK